jgi:beta-N-acetylhexosaminidase
MTRWRKSPTWRRWVSAGALAVLAGSTMGLAGCGTAQTPEPRTQPSGDKGGDQADPVAAIVGRMSDEDLVGQVFMPYAYGRDAVTVSPGTAAANQSIGGVDTPAQLVAKFRLGGLILVGFGGDDPDAKDKPVSNVATPGQVRELTTGLQAAAGKLPAQVPLLIGMDQEYGVVQRLRTGVTSLPSAMAFGAANRPELTEAAWKAAAGELATIGVNLNFAPDADVLGPQQVATVIGSRSYGADPKVVSAQVAAVVRGMAAGHVAAVLKHFPGHGKTVADSHTELPVLQQQLAALEADDLAPFAAGIKAGAPLVMSGHLDVRSVDPGVPATFSHKVVTGLLREKLGFDGVVVTDAMDMAPAQAWPAGEAAVRALLAGNDLLLQPKNLPAAYAGVLDALRSGRLPRARLVEAVSRIVKVKTGLTGAPSADLATVGSRGGEVAPLAAAAVTLLRGGCAGPLVGASVRVTASAGRDVAVRTLTAALTANGATVRQSGGADVSTIHLVGYGDTAKDLARGAAATVAMDTPYVLANADSKALLATYSSSEQSLKALAAVLMGKAAPTGRSPVVVSGLPASSCD